MSQSVAQQNVTIMAEEQQARRPTLRRNSSIAASMGKPLHSLTRWVCIRYVDLESVDGLAPIPTVLSWVRDGLLVVGMPSEMRVYSQWNFKPVKETPKPEVPHKSVQQKTVKIMGIRPVASASNLSASRSQLMLDQVLKLSTSKSPLEIKLDSKSETRSIDTRLNQFVDTGVLKVVVEEGLFEAARLASPILPQYHPQGNLSLLTKTLFITPTKTTAIIVVHIVFLHQRLLLHASTKVSRAIAHPVR